jgi:hypothetical protein
MQAFGRDMPVTLVEKQAGEFHPLAGGTQARLTQPRRGLGRQILGRCKALAMRFDPIPSPICPIQVCRGDRL